jgi:hypothetical protein
MWALANSIHSRTERFLWHLCWKPTDVSEGNVASIFMVEEKAKQNANLRANDKLLAI